MGRISLMRSAALFTLALAMLSFSFTGCHTLSVHRGAGCSADGCSTCNQADCGCGVGHGGLIGNGGLLGHLGHGHHAMSACPQCGVRGLLGSHCRRCGCNLLGGGAHGTPYTQPFAGPYGPTTPTVGYPYYTTRAPRDFLVNNPPTIGR